MKVILPCLPKDTLEARKRKKYMQWTDIYYNEVPAM